MRRPFILTLVISCLGDQRNAQEQALLDFKADSMPPEE